MNERVFKVDSYMVLSLPKGYRITGYKIVFLDNLNNYTVNNSSFGRTPKTVYETNSDYDYDNYLAKTPTTSGTNSDIQEYVIERTSMNETDMGNQIYFRIVHNRNSLFLLTIKSFEVYFTAEGTFSADVKPESAGPAVSCVASPFKTSKIDIGEVKSQTKNGATYYAYDYRNVQDLIAYNYLYQEDAIQDGVPTDVASEKKITPLKVDGDDCYALKNGTYYVETPIEITTSSGNTSPIGYRIVGALFNYTFGTATQASQEVKTFYYVKYTVRGTTYYLNTQGKFVTGTPTAWELDDEGHLHNGPRYLACSITTQYNFWGTVSGYTYALSIGNAATTNKLSVDNSNRLYFYHNRGNRYLQGTTSSSATPSLTNSTTNAATTEQHQESIQIPAFTPGAYTLNVYDKTGSEIQETISVASNDDRGMYDMGLCNNDAVKFSITGLEEGKQALVSVTLLLQALDPYIDKMDIQCTDDTQVLKLTETFTADDFSVSGGKFIFHIPEEYVDEELTFTFKDLYSKYGDETYYDHTGKGAGRYSFVTSPYFSPVNGNGNDGLYDTAYDPDAEYDNKVYTSTAGNVRFKFNNAEDLSNTGGETATGYLEEYPFSAATYLNNYADPDGGSEVGEFIECHLNAGEEDQKSGIYFVFTADETRWNIAPSTAWQHRYYAYYRMEIELRAQAFIPVLEWKKIYDKTLCENNGAIDDASQWGLALSTEENGSTLDVGYLTYYEIINAINGALDGSETNAPASTEQILYVDGSALYSMVNSSVKDETTNENVTISLEDLQEILAPNALVFLPENNTSTLDNVAYKTSSGSFHAGKDIVLTDKKPFYSPYDIQVDAANYARYDRKITIDKNGKVTKASIILPFNFTVDSEGKHTNEDDGTTPFAVHTMQADNCLDVEQEKPVAYFPVLSNVTTTEANTPYLVEVLNQSSDASINFVLSQKGATIKATTAMGDDYTFEGETASGTADGNSYSFKHYGGFAGKILAIGGHYYYYSRNQFVNSDELNPTLEYAKLQPFRSFYVASGSSTNMMPFFDVVLGENPNAGSDGITEKRQDTNLRIKTGYHTLTLMSGKAQTVSINNINGSRIKEVRMKQGDIVNFNIPAGIYIVNGVKITIM